MKSFDMHAGKGVAQCIILPMGEPGFFSETLPESVPIQRCKQCVAAIFAG